MTETAGFVSRRTSFTIYRNNSSSTLIIPASVSAFFSTFEGNEMSILFNARSLMYFKDMHGPASWFRDHRGSVASVCKLVVKCLISGQILFVLFHILKGVFSVVEIYVFYHRLVRMSNSDTSPLTGKLFSFSASCELQEKMERYFNYVTNSDMWKIKLCGPFSVNEYQQTENTLVLFEMTDL